MTAEENRIDRAKRFSKIWSQSRSDCGVSQQYMAQGLGVSKKTIQNWERGTSSPSFFQGTEWFHLLGLNPLPYYFQFVFPNAFPDYLYSDEDESIKQALTNLIETLPTQGKIQLLYLFYGEHGSSPYSVLQMLTAHLQVPMKERVSHASIIMQDYEMEKELGNLTNPDDVQPDLDLLEIALKQCKKAALKKQSGYSSNVLSDV